MREHSQQHNPNAANTSTIGRPRPTGFAIASPCPSGTSPGVSSAYSPIEFEKLLTIDEISEHLRLTPQQVYSLTRRKRNGGRALPAYRGIGKRLLFRLSEVAEWVQQRKAT